MFDLITPPFCPVLCQSTRHQENSPSAQRLLGRGRSLEEPGRVTRIVVQARVEVSVGLIVRSFLLLFLLLSSTGSIQKCLLILSPRQHVLGNPTSFPFVLDLRLCY